MASRFKAHLLSPPAVRSRSTSNASEHSFLASEDSNDMFFDTEIVDHSVHNHFNSSGVSDIHALSSTNYMDLDFANTEMFAIDENDTLLDQYHNDISVFNDNNNSNNSNNSNSNNETEFFEPEASEVESGGSELSWDKHHIFNAENTYCYCRGPRDPAKAMLQCKYCRQWFHPGCTEVFQNRRLYHGEHKILDFACRDCCGTEYLHEYPRGWKEIAMLAMLNVIIESACRSHKVKSVTDYLDNDWGVTAGRIHTATWWNTVSSAITTNQKLFANVGDYHYTILNLDEKYPEAVVLLPPASTAIPIIKRSIPSIQGLSPKQKRNVADTDFIFDGADEEYTGCEVVEVPKRKKRGRKPKNQLQLPQSPPLQYQPPQPVQHILPQPEQPRTQVHDNTLETSVNFEDFLVDPSPQPHVVSDNIPLPELSSSPVLPHEATPATTKQKSVSHKKRGRGKFEWVGEPFTKTEDDSDLYSAFTKDGITFRVNDFVYIEPNDEDFLKFLNSKKPQNGLSPPAAWVVQIVDLIQSEERGMHFFGHWFYTWNDIDYLSQSRPEALTCEPHIKTELDQKQIDDLTASLFGDDNTDTETTETEIHPHRASLKRERDYSSTSDSNSALNNYNPKYRHRDHNELFVSFETVYKPLSAIVDKCYTKFVQEDTLGVKLETGSSEQVFDTVETANRHYVAIGFNASKGMFYSLPKDVIQLWESQQQYNQSAGAHDDSEEEIDVERVDTDDGEDIGTIGRGSRLVRSAHTNARLKSLDSAKVRGFKKPTMRAYSASAEASTSTSKRGRIGKSEGGPKKKKGKRTADFDINKMVSYDSRIVPRWSMLEVLKAAPAKKIDTPGYREVDGEIIFTGEADIDTPASMAASATTSGFNFNHQAPAQCKPPSSDEGSSEEDTSDELITELHLRELAKEQIRREAVKKKRKDIQKEKLAAAAAAAANNNESSSNDNSNNNNKGAHNTTSPSRGDGNSSDTHNDTNDQTSEIAIAADVNIAFSTSLDSGSSSSSFTDALGTDEHDFQSFLLDENSHDFAKY